MPRFFYSGYLVTLQLGSAYGVIDIKTAQAHANIMGLQRGVGSLRGGLLGLNPVLGATGLALGGATVAVGGLAGVIGHSVGKASNLEAQLSEIRSKTGATSEEMDDLRGLIDDLFLDPNLKVSAFEAADAIELLGRNGLSVAEIMGGAAHATVLMANATGSEFGPAADLATDVMDLFNVEAKDMISVVDGVTAVVNNSKFSFNDYRLFIAQAGGQAAAFGVELEDLNTVMVATSSLFASGSDAGTSFKTFLSSLIPKSKEAKETMEALGLEFFDAEGKLKSMGDVSTELYGKLFDEFETTVQLGGATDDMVKAAEKATNKIPGLTTKLSEQEAQLAILQRELGVTTQRYGEGSIQADKKRLAIDKLTNKINTNKSALGEHQQALDAMTNATIETITSTTKLTEEQRAATLTTLFGADGIRTAVGLAGQGKVVYTDMAKAAEELGVSQDELNKYIEGGITEYEKLQITMSKASATEAAAIRMDNLAGDMEILQGVIESISLSIGDKFLPSTRNAVQQFTQILTENADAIVEFFGYIADGSAHLLTLANYLYLAAQSGDPLNNLLSALPASVRPFALAIGNLVSTTGELSSAIDAVAIIGELSAIFFGANTNIYDTTDAIREFLLALGLSPETVNQADSLLRSLGNASQQLVGSLRNGAAAALDFFAQIARGFNEGGLAGAADAFWSWVGDAAATGPDILNGILDFITSFLLEQWPVINETLKVWGDQFWSWVEDVAIPRAIEELNKLGAAMQTWAESPDGSQRLQMLGFAIATALMGGLELAFANTEQVTSILGALMASLVASIPALTEGFLSVGQSIAAGVFQGIYNYITGEEPAQQAVTLFGEMWRGVMQTLITTVVPATSLAFANENYTKIKEAIAKIDWIQIGLDMMDGIKQGIEDGAGAIVGAATSAAQDALDSAKSFLGISSPSRLTADQIGLPFSQGAARGIAQGLPDIENAAQQALNVVSQPDISQIIPTPNPQPSRISTSNQPTLVVNGPLVSVEGVTGDADETAQKSSRSVLTTLRSLGITPA